jgi:hypothetical protein
MTSSELENYLTLLNIRRIAGRRDTLIMGGIFFLSLAAIVVFGLLNQLSGKSVYITTALTVVFGIGYLTTWAKLEITKGMIELVQYLQRAQQR